MASARARLAGTGSNTPTAGVNVVGSDVDTNDNRWKNIAETVAEASDYTPPADSSNSGSTSPADSSNSSDDGSNSGSTSPADSSNSGDDSSNSGSTSPADSSNSGDDGSSSDDDGAGNDGYPRPVYENNSNDGYPRPVYENNSNDDTGNDDTGNDDAGDDEESGDPAEPPPRDYKEYEEPEIEYVNQLDDGKIQIGIINLGTDERMEPVFTDVTSVNKDAVIGPLYREYMRHQGELDDQRKYGALADEAPLVEQQLAEQQAMQDAQTGVGQYETAAAKKKEQEQNDKAKKQQEAANNMAGANPQGNEIPEASTAPVNKGPSIKEMPTQSQKDAPADEPSVTKDADGTATFTDWLAKEARVGVDKIRLKDGRVVPVRQPDIDYALKVIKNRKPVATQQKPPLHHGGDNRKPATPSLDALQAADRAAYRQGVRQGDLPRPTKIPEHLLSAIQDK